LRQRFRREVVRLSDLTVNLEVFYVRVIPLVPICVSMDPFQMPATSALRLRAKMAAGHYKKRSHCNLISLPEDSLYGFT
jgi:hypothetical protein